MDSSSAAGQPITVTRRAQIIQRVLVDGWTVGHAAEICGIEERQIARWVADYRRRGMASLRGEIGSERLYRRVLARVRSALVRDFGLVPPGVERATCVVLPSARDDERRRR